MRGDATCSSPSLTVADAGMMRVSSLAEVVRSSDGQTMDWRTRWQLMMLMREAGYGMILMRRKIGMTVAAGLQSLLLVTMMMKMMHRPAGETHVVEKRTLTPVPDYRQMRDWTHGVAVEDAVRRMMEQQQQSLVMQILMVWSDGVCSQRQDQQLRELSVVQTGVLPVVPAYSSRDRSYRPVASHSRPRRPPPPLAPHAS